MSEDTHRGQSLASPSGGDYLLEHMVRLCDTEGVKIGVTLYVGGAVVTGLLVSGREFMEGCASRFLESQGPPEAKSTLVDFLRKTDQGQPPGDAGGDDVTSHTGYAHLQEARLVEGGKQVTSGIWWRCRIDRVDAFHFGMLRDSEVGHPRAQ